MMSHSVTIRTQTTTTSTVGNTGYLRTWGGIIKFLQLALGVVCVGITGDYMTYAYLMNANLFFLLISTTFMIGTFILLLSYIASPATWSITPKGTYELLYHAIAFGLILAAALTLLVELGKRNVYKHELLYGAAICGLVNAGLYLFSTIMALRTYRGIWDFNMDKR